MSTDSPVTQGETKEEGKYERRIEAEGRVKSLTVKHRTGTKHSADSINAAYFTVISIATILPAITLEISKLALKLSSGRISANHKLFFKHFPIMNAMIIQDKPINKKKKKRRKCHLQTEEKHKIIVILWIRKGLLI